MDHPHGQWRRRTLDSYVTDVTRKEAVDEQTLVGNCGRRRGRGISRLARGGDVASSVVSAPGSATAREARIHEILDGLFRERRALRTTALDRGLLEANRLSIVYWQHQLAPTRDST